MDEKALEEGETPVRARKCCVHSARQHKILYDNYPVTLRSILDRFQHDLALCTILSIGGGVSWSDPGHLRIKGISPHALWRAASDKTTSRLDPLPLERDWYSRGSDSKILMYWL